jgi:hypothetical protein
MTLDDIRPRKRPPLHPVNDEMKQLVRDKRLSRLTVATMLKIPRHVVDNWMGPNPNANCPQHYLTALKELLDVKAKK